MSEKRVFCFEVEVNCRHLHFGGYINGKTVLHCVSKDDWKDITEKDCKNCKKARYLGLPREQAIEKMAKAIRKVITIISPEACQEGAEAALDALLEANNGK